MGNIQDEKTSVTVTEAREGLGRSLGDLLRGWRSTKRFSQMALAHAAQVSTRHLSFIENGHAQPGREVLIRLSDVLGLSLRERNRLLLAGGFAPVYSDAIADPGSDLNLRQTVERIVTAAGSYPAIVFDRHWNLVSMNTAARIFTEGVSSDLLDDPVCVLRVLFHPNGVGSRISNASRLRAAMLGRVERQANISGDPVLQRLVRELRHYMAASGDSAEDLETRLHSDIAETFTLKTASGPIRMLSTIATFGTPLEVSTSELAIETFYPADPDSAIVLERHLRSLVRDLG